MAKQTFTTGQVLTAAQMTSLQQTAMGGGSPSTKTASYVLVAADAGTVIQMNSASATTITVNTSLFAAGDSVQIQNIGAGTVTITAGTATVNSAGSLGVTQWDGGFLYFTSSSAAIWFDYTQAGTSTPLTTKGDLFGFDTANARVPIGTNGQVLTADSAQALGLKWASPSGATQTFTAINSGGTSLSGSSTVTISGLSGYNQILMFYKNASTNTSTACNVRLNADSGLNYYSARMWFGWGASNAVTGNGGLVDGANAFTGGQTADAAGSAHGSYHIFGANSTGIKPIFGWGTGQATGGEMWTVNGYYAGTSVISSISLVSANTFDAGTIYVWGA